MVPQTPTQVATANSDAGSNFLRKVLQADALLCALTAVALLTATGPIASLLGLTDHSALYATALALAVYVAALLLITSRERLNLQASMIAPAVNIAAAALSAALLVTDWLPLSTVGKWIVGMMGIAVLGLALLQIYAFKRATNH